MSGFGPFEKVIHNASGALAEQLEASPPAGMRIQSQLLPVSYARSDELLTQALAGREVELLVGLGQQPAHGFRLEMRAASGSCVLTRPDVDGVPGGRSSWAREPGSPWHDDMWTTLEQQLARFVSGRPAWMRSSSAGGYLCERVFRWLLEEAKARGIPALFVHVPPLCACPLEAQLEELEGLLSELQF